MVRFIKIRKIIRDYLSDGPKDFRPILEEVNSKTYQGQTSKGLGMILHRDPDFKVVKRERQLISYSSAERCIWALRDYNEAGEN